MGVDRYLTYKGEVIANCGRMHRFEDAYDPDDREIYLELWRLIRLYDTDFDAFMEGVDEWVVSVRNTGAAELLEEICEDDDMGVVDE